MKKEGLRGEFVEMERPFHPPFPVLGVLGRTMTGRWLLGTYATLMVHWARRDTVCPADESRLDLPGGRHVEGFARSGPSQVSRVFI